MKVKIAEKEYTIRFYHENRLTETGVRGVKLSDLQNPKQSFTKCTIEDEDRNVLSEGIAKVSRKDIFNKSYGRKISMKKALDNFRINIKDTYQKVTMNNENNPSFMSVTKSEKLSKSERKSVWDVYFSLHKK